MVAEQLKAKGLVLKNYKEPLKEVEPEKGFGYYGAIILTEDGKGIQCHLCGEIVGQLPGHIYFKHKIKPTAYKEMFQLSPMTRLISEEQRMVMKQRTLDWLKTRTPEEIAAWRSKGSAALKARTIKGKKQPKGSLEQQNVRGACPDQTLDKIREVAARLGHTPSRVEMMNETGGQRYLHLVDFHFGSWGRALNMMGLNPNTNRGKGAFVPTYTKEALLEYLKIYAQENGRIPTTTDARRGLIPTLPTYQRHFGNFENARVEAGIYQILGIKKPEKITPHTNKVLTQ